MKKYLLFLFILFLCPVLSWGQGYLYAPDIASGTNDGNFKNITANATYGSELITWTAAGWNEDGVTWTFAAGVLTHVTGNTTAVTGTVTGALTVGRTARVMITGTGGTATATYTLGGVTGTTIAASGAIAIVDFLTTTADSELVITPANTCTVAITNISVMELVNDTGDLTVDGNLTVRSPATFLGQVDVPAGLAGTPAIQFNGSDGIYQYGVGTLAFSTGVSMVHYFSGASHWINSNTGSLELGTSADVKITRDAAQTLGIRNSTNQQKVNIYNTAVSATADYERLALTGVQGASVNLTAETNGTGADNLDIVLTPAGTGKTTSTAEIVGTNYKTIYIPASACTATATNGATFGTYEYTTQDINMDYYAFDGTTEQYIEFQLPMPEDWNRGTIKAKFFWSSATGSTATDTCEWEILGGALSNDDAIDAALGTAQVISDALLADNGADMQLSGATPALTVGGTPALADMVHFKVSRNVGGTDDMTEAAWLYGIWIQYLANTSVVIW